MIVCLHHGSSNENINKSNTFLITKHIKEIFKGEKVVESFYSNKITQPKGHERLAFKSIIEDNYQLEEKIYVLLTTLVTGIERKKVLRYIQKVDKDNKIIINTTLLDRNNLVEVSNILKEGSFNFNKTHIIYIGHGIKRSTNKEYLSLEEQLNNGESYQKYFVCLIEGEKSIEQIIPNLNYKDLIIHPLMFSCGHHYKKDIKDKIIPLLESNGFNIKMDELSLSNNSNIRNFYINELIKMGEK